MSVYDAEGNLVAGEGFGVLSWLLKQNGLNVIFSVDGPSSYNLCSGMSGQDSPRQESILKASSMRINLIVPRQRLTANMDNERKEASNLGKTRQAKKEKIQNKNFYIYKFTRRNVT